jgi:aldose 1-epimerase
MAQSLSSRIFGVLPNGQSVEAWTLSGSGGLSLEAITYGATITRLVVPGRDGSATDVVLGFNNLQSYLASPSYIGAMIGRVAGRVTGGRFTLEGKTYELARNEAPNHLHGGVEGFDKKLWTAEPFQNGGPPSLRLTYRSPGGEEGYPGAVNVTVTYTVTDGNVLLVESEAVTDHPTPLALTQHSYFNLAGESAGSIADHELQIHADESVAVDDRMTLLGRLDSVAGRGNDFRQSRCVGAAIPQLFRHHGDLYRIRRAASGDPPSRLAPAARLFHPGSGRLLEVSTTEAYMQLYTGSGLDGSVAGKSGVPYAPHAGLCLECQGYADGPNASALGDIILRPGTSRRETTAYAFSAIGQ